MDGDADADGDADGDADPDALTDSPAGPGVSDNGSCGCAVPSTQSSTGVLIDLIGLIFT